MKVSVITTLYNYELYIGACIKSFLDQDFPDSEMIVVDDHSTDGSYAFARLWECDRVKVIRLKENGNYSHAKNVGIRAAKADVLVMLDADDMLTHKGISLRYAKLQEGYDFVHGPCIVLKKGRQPYRAGVWNKYLRTRHYRDIHAQTVMLRKSIHSEIGLYDEELWSKSDYEMWARIHNHQYGIGFVTEDVSFYRMHDKQMHLSKRKVEMYDEITREVEAKIVKRKTDLSDLQMLGDRNERGEN